MEFLCSVCESEILSQFEPIETRGSLSCYAPCGHTFHRACLQELLEGSEGIACPSCKMRKEKIIDLRFDVGSTTIQALEGCAEEIPSSLKARLELVREYLKCMNERGDEMSDLDYTDITKYGFISWDIRQIFVRSNRNRITTKIMDAFQECCPLVDLSIEQAEFIKRKLELIKEEGDEEAIAKEEIDSRKSDTRSFTDVDVEDFFCKICERSLVCYTELTKFPTQLAVGFAQGGLCCCSLCGCVSHELCLGSRRTGSETMCPDCQEFVSNDERLKIIMSVAPKKAVDLRAMPVPLKEKLSLINKYANRLVDKCLELGEFLSGDEVKRICLPWNVKAGKEEVARKRRKMCAEKTSLYDAIIRLLAASIKQAELLEQEWAKAKNQKTLDVMDMDNEPGPSKKLRVN